MILKLEEEQKQQNRPQKSSGNQRTQTPPNFANMLEKMDSNNDEKISTSEAKGKLKENFKNRDRNKDGFITEDEMTRKRR